MKTDDFDYYLPEELIAQVPLEHREESRLLVMDRDTGKLEDKKFYNIVDYLHKGDVLVLNDTKVMPARLIGEKEDTGAIIEVLLLKNIDGNNWECLVKPAKRIHKDTIVSFGNGLLKAKCTGVNDEGIRNFEFIYDGIFYEILDKFIEKISIDIYHEENYEKTAFGKYNLEIQDKTIINDLHFTPKGLWDMTFKNCFYIDNDFYFFDQEWDEPNLPVEYILYRSILYTISLRRFIKIEDLLEKYNLTKYLELFKKLDDKMQEMVRDDETWKSYKQNNIIDIDATKQELINQNIRNKAQEQEIENLNIRSNAQKAEADNLKEQIRNLTEENKKLRKQYIRIPNWRFLWRKK